VNDVAAGADVAAILDRLAQRRSCRAFDGSTMPRELVDAIIRDGLQAPSSCNQQQWHFIAVDDPALKRRAHEIAGGNPHFLDAAVIIYLCFQKGWTHDKFSIVQSVAGACYHMMLSAHLRGYDSIWNAGIGDTRAVAQMLGVPPIVEIQGALCLGRARVDAPEMKAPRRPQDAVHSWNRFARPAASLYPVKRARAYPFFAITNTRNPYAVWDPAIWGWDRLADFRGYAVWNKSPLAGVYLHRSHERVVEREVASLPDLDAGAHLLELLPWGGVHTALLRRRYGESVHLHIAELSPHNHAFILERIRQEGISSANIHADSCAGGRLSCADASIDAALLPRVLEHVPEPWRMLDELKRVLKPGGIAVISVRNRLSGEMRREHAAARKAQVPNTGPWRPLSARALQRELARRFTIVDELGLSPDERPVGRSRLAPIYAVRITRP
jgi:nitroreductase/ubiquinone/menaquinone biosynthesis C-methylase UbiE